MLSFWQKDIFSQPADVVIAGAGFVGLWCAYELKRRHPQLKITVLEKENFPGGASVRNAGFACFGSPGEMLADAETMGEEAMWQVVRLRYKGIQKLRSVLGDATIHYDDCGGFECFKDNILFQKRANKLDWLNEGMKKITGVDGVFKIADDQLSTLGLKNFQHLIYNSLEGGLHSGKTIQALLQKVIAMGVNVMFGMEVKSWEQNQNVIAIFLDNEKHQQLNTTRFLIATNAFVNSLANNFSVLPARGQILLTEPIEGLQLRGTFHFDEGYYYWRNIGNRILIGGARNTDFANENTFQLSTSETIQLALQEFISKHIDFDGEVKVEHRWAGIMAFTQNKRPLIVKQSPNVWAVVACNGMGVALAPSIAEEVADKIFS